MLQRDATNAEIVVALNHVIDKLDKLVDVVETSVSNGTTHRMELEQRLTRMETENKIAKWVMGILVSGMALALIEAVVDKI